MIYNSVIYNSMIYNIAVYRSIFDTMHYSRYVVFCDETRKLEKDTLLFKSPKRGMLLTHVVVVVGSVRIDSDKFVEVRDDVSHVGDRIQSSHHGYYRQHCP